MAKTKRNTGAGYYKSENIEKFKIALENARAEIRSGSSLKVSISAKNEKMGAIPSVSVLPFITCPASCAKTCGVECYTAKIALIRSTVLKAYARNTAIYLEKPAEYWRQVEAAIMGSRFFRFNVAGDLVNAEYFNKIVEIATRQAHCKILVFTKKWYIVNAFIDNGGVIPENLQVIFSAWENLQPVNPYKLPESNVIMPDAETVPENWKICGGNCFECFCRGVGCWECKKGDTIAFKLH